jgi:hypothetical protein
LDKTIVDNYNADATAHGKLAKETFDNHKEVEA